jgi:putative CocE/NonD family hydrolase
VTDLVVQRDVAVPMRDGVVTRADVWRPADAGPCPAILLRTPYDKSWIEHQSPIAAGLAADRGYALVIQDVRGRFASAGIFAPFRQERADGHDSIAWLAGREWCSGEVVMTGWSYVGATQWLAAEAGPPQLRAIAPLNSSPSYGEGWTFRGGVLERGLIGSWVAAAIGAVDRLRPDQVETALYDEALLAELLPDAAGWTARPASDPYWGEVSVDVRSVPVPVLHVGGWYDVLNAATLAGWRRREDPRDRLIVGPWAHDNLFGHLVADRNLGAAGAGPTIGLGERLLDFFDSALAERPSALPRASVFELGARRWLELDGWPPADARSLALGLPGGEFEVRPEDLPPSLGGRGILVGVPGFGWGPRDQRPLADRDDVLCLEAPPLAAGPTTLAGPVAARLRVEARGGSVRQWTVVLCLRAPDGRLEVLTEGIAQAPTPADEVEVQLGDVCVAVPADSRLVALVGGGSVPRWEPVRTAGRQRVLDGSELVVTTT